jgi:hypothetical protein
MDNKHTNENILEIIMTLFILIWTIFIFLKIEFF